MLVPCSALPRTAEGEQCGGDKVLSPGCRGKKHSNRCVCWSDVLVLTTLNILD